MTRCRLLAALPLLLAACAEEGGTTILDATVTCTGDLAKFTLRTSGTPPARATVFSQETGNRNPQYADEHTFPTDGTENDLVLELLAGGAAGVEDETLFTCADHHGSPEGVMTYAYRTYDAAGEQTDCVVQGDDPARVIAGGNRVNNPSRAAELADCWTDPGVY